MSKYELWAQRIADCQTSGLSQRAYCQQHGLATSTFYVWLRKLRHSNQEPTKDYAAFLPVVIQSKPPLCPSTIAINTNGLAFDCSVEQLAQLITALSRYA